VIVIPFLEPEKTARVVIKNIPVEDVRIKNGLLFANYDYFKVFPVSLVRGGKSEEVSRNVLEYHPTHTDFLNGHWLRRWGYLYNIDEIERYKEDTRDFLRYVLCDQFGVYLWMPKYEDSAPTPVVERLRRLPNKFLFWLVSNRVVLPIICWTGLLLRLHILRTLQEENEEKRRLWEQNHPSSSRTQDSPAQV
jgi:hypothetical protein